MPRSALVFFALLIPLVAFADSSTPVMEAVEQSANELEARIGFSAHDLETGQRWEYNADQRFPLSSTFKTLACANLLYRKDQGKLTLNETVSISEADLVAYSPVTGKLAGNRPVTLAELCEATQTMSDNTAANMILKVLGGPESVTAFARFLGDDSTRLDRWETELNEGKPGDPRDTTTPNAMVHDLTRLLLGEVLSSSSRDQLREWSQGNQVADGLFRASLPEDWVIADRTGAGGYGSRAITAVIWAPERKPVVVALYITETEASFAQRNEAIADIGSAIVTALRETH